MSHMAWMASCRSALMSPRLMRERMFSIMTGRGRPFTKTLGCVSRRYADRRVDSRVGVEWLGGSSPVYCSSSSWVAREASKCGQGGRYSHISQPRKLLFIFPVQCCQLLLLFLGTRLQLCLLFSALLAFDFLLAEPGVRAKDL